MSDILPYEVLIVIWSELIEILIINWIGQKKNLRLLKNIRIIVVSLSLVETALVIAATLILIKLLFQEIIFSSIQLLRSIFKSELKVNKLNILIWKTSGYDEHHKQWNSRKYYQWFLFVNRRENQSRFFTKEIT